MKKIVILLLSLFIAQSALKADNDKPINNDQLPATSQQIIKDHFPGHSIALVKVEREFFEKSYEVIFTNGNKIEFDRKGNWTEVDCKHSPVPDAFIPTQIKNYVSKNYPGVSIFKIEKEDKKYFDVDLANHLELKFDSKFNLIDIDN